ncbi:uncharacterized protein LOC134815011 [Bolinopsis microptera]|uniref:uncharacterized protein LOC134815011 n=1 Tax=Bolinopsis microptera TaxID=2820187 RepID=UPI0030797868
MKTTITRFDMAVLLVKLIGITFSYLMEAAPLHNSNSSQYLVISRETDLIRSPVEPQLPQETDLGDNKNPEEIDYLAPGSLVLLKTADDASFVTKELIATNSEDDNDAQPNDENSQNLTRKNEEHHFVRANDLDILYLEKRPEKTDFPVLANDDSIETEEADYWRNIGKRSEDTAASISSAKSGANVVNILILIVISLGGLGAGILIIGVLVATFIPQLIMSRDYLRPLLRIYEKVSGPNQYRLHLEDLATLKNKPCAVRDIRINGYDSDDSLDEYILHWTRCRQSQTKGAGDKRRKSRLWWTDSNTKYHCEDEEEFIDQGGAVGVRFSESLSEFSESEYDSNENDF